MFLFGNFDLFVALIQHLNLESYQHLIQVNRRLLSYRDRRAYARPTCVKLSHLTYFTHVNLRDEQYNLICNSENALKNASFQHLLFLELNMNAVQKTSLWPSKLVSLRLTCTTISASTFDHFSSLTHLRKFKLNVEHALCEYIRVPLSVKYFSYAARHEDARIIICENSPLKILHISHFDSLMVGQNSLLNLRYLMVRHQIIDKLPFHIMPRLEKLSLPTSLILLSMTLPTHIYKLEIRQYTISVNIPSHISHLKIHYLFSSLHGTSNHYVSINLVESIILNPLSGQYPDLRKLKINEKQINSQIIDFEQFPHLKILHVGQCYRYLHLEQSNLQLLKTINLAYPQIPNTHTLNVQQWTYSDVLKILSNSIHTLIIHTPPKFYFNIHQIPSHVKHIMINDQVTIRK